ncbi:hypothetical protein chiPu_0019767 [Chiloscyllium punctatum]|uniref:Uncharacterized protein n=1 Tax=Chiloscyllium punctatum TaxID=137246 RepID=A0A401RT46_CHIPU|nr:hypothetical protein [Chiloscyllium punctatum]
MSVQNPYSDVQLPTKTYFANEAFEADQGSQSSADGELKERSPPSFPGDTAQRNGAPGKSQPALVANPYGSIYPPAGSSKHLGVEEEEASPPCACCRLCKCCRCCYSHCVLS